MSLDDLSYRTFDRTALSAQAQMGMKRPTEAVNCKGKRYDSEDRKKRSGLDGDP